MGIENTCYPKTSRLMGIDWEYQWVYGMDRRIYDPLLVGGFKHGFYFPFHIWFVILPIGFTIFQRARLKPPTSMIIYPIINHHI